MYSKYDHENHLYLHIRPEYKELVLMFGRIKVNHQNNLHTVIEIFKKLMLVD